MFRPTVIAISLLALAGACSSKKNNPTTDAPNGSDSGSNSNCMSVTPPDFAYSENLSSSGSYVTWAAQLPASLEGDGGTSEIDIGFFGPTTGTVDLASGDQANYKTCTTCIEIDSLSADGMSFTRRYFQDGGTVMVAQDPLATEHLTMTATDVSVVEVTIADDLTSTPVVGGKCIALGSFTVENKHVPTGWTCDPAKYLDGASCDCACGAHDADCDVAANPVAGCTTGQICSGSDGATCETTCDLFSNPAVGCTGTLVCGIESGTNDVCYAANDTRFSAAALGATCTPATALECGVQNGLAKGICDQFVDDDLTCRKICNDATDCTGVNQVCEAIVGAKGVCVTKPQNDTCGTATTLVIGAPATAGTTGAATSDYDMGLEPATCTGFSQPGADVVYKVTTVAPNTSITVKLTNVTTDFDPSISIAGPGAAACGTTTTCLAGADAGTSGEDETVTYVAATAGDYFLIVDSAGSQTGSFKIQVVTP